MNVRSRRLLLALAAGMGAAALIAARRRALARRYSFEGRVVVITGGSRGLGLLLAREVAAEGARVVLLARSEGELRRAVKDLEARGAAEVLALSCDVRHRHQVEDAIARTIARFGRIDVLVNNAGVVQVGPIEHMAVEDFEESLAVHFYGPLYAIFAALDVMRAQGEGRIVNVSSIGGKVAVPHLVPYSAGKFALVGLSEGLASELRASHIKVTTVCPWLMRTGSTAHGSFKGRHREEYAWFAIGGSLPLLSVDARKCAHRILDACRRGDPVLVLTPHARLATAASALFPTLTARLLAVMNRLLPAARDDASTAAHSGFASASPWAPSFLTRLGDRAAHENNEE